MIRSNTITNAILREVVSHRAVRFVLAFGLLIIASTGYANQPSTWKLSKNFGKTIGCGFFFDENHGLIGSGVRPTIYYDNDFKVYLPTHCDTISIYRTSDGGATWVECVIPTKITGAVTSISMMDSLRGYASIFTNTPYNLFGTYNSTGIWQTRDGGKTWFDSLHVDHVLSCIYAQPGLLMYTRWDNNFFRSDPFGGACSYDSGATWTDQFSTAIPAGLDGVINSRVGNGIDFSDSLNGVASMLNQDTGMCFWVTTDAGHTWQPTSAQMESWSVHAVQGERIYLCSNESQTHVVGAFPYQGLDYTSINISYDSGFTWQQLVKFPVMHFTGTIEGVGNTLYFQTDTLYYGDNNQYNPGLYRSDDLGQNWHWVGGPMNSRDTRFVVTGCEGQVVYAFDGVGGVWKTIDGGDGTLHGDVNWGADTINWIPRSCGDTLYFRLMGSCCIPFTVDSIGVAQASEFLQLQETDFPKIFQEGDTAGAAVLYDPTHTGSDRDIIRIYGHDDYHLISHDIVINTTNSYASSFLVWNDSSSVSAAGCSVAYDTVYLNNLSCPGMMLDSVLVSSSEIEVENSLPASVSDVRRFPLRFLFHPDSSGQHIYTAHLYAHAGRRLIDTVITINAIATRPALQFVLDSTKLNFSTSLCHPQTETFRIATTSCDSVTIDSILFDRHNFIPDRQPNSIAPGIGDSVVITYFPDSIASVQASVHIFGHGRFSSIDTVISLSAQNIRVPQGVALSATSLSLATSHCSFVADSIAISNQGCETLLIDSVILPSPDLGVDPSYRGVSIVSTDSAYIKLNYVPTDGVSKTLPMHVLMHTASRKIDTIVTLKLSNIISSTPLSLSSDSIYLFTKYCQPVTLPLTMLDNACFNIAIDSAVIMNDSRNEFSASVKQAGVNAQDSIHPEITFLPDSTGAREAKLKIYSHLATGERTDTTITLLGKNLTAPDPYLPPIAGAVAGKQIRIPVYLLPTTDTFSITSYVAHLKFHTDLLTGHGIDFAGTCSNNVIDSHVDAEPGNGMSIRVKLGTPLTDTSQLRLPLCYAVCDVYLTRDSITPVVLDTFTTDREPALALCSTPSQEFQLVLSCGDPLTRELFNTGTVAFDIVSVAPNPVKEHDSWNVRYSVSESTSELYLKLFDGQGSEVSSNAIEASKGEHSFVVPTPSTNGDYFLAVMNGQGRRVVKVTVTK